MAARGSGKSTTQSIHTRSADMRPPVPALYLSSLAVRVGDEVLRREAGRGAAGAMVPRERPSPLEREADQLADVQRALDRNRIADPANGGVFVARRELAGRDVGDEREVHVQA